MTIPTTYHYVEILWQGSPRIRDRENDSNLEIGFVDFEFNGLSTKISITIPKGADPSVAIKIPFRVFKIDKLQMAEKLRVTLEQIKIIRIKIHFFRQNQFLSDNDAATIEEAIKLSGFFPKKCISFTLQQKEDLDLWQRYQICIRSFEGKMEAFIRRKENVSIGSNPSSENLREPYDLNAISDRDLKSNSAAITQKVIEYEERRQEAIFESDETRLANASKYELKYLVLAISFLEEILKRDKTKQKVDNLCTKQALEMFKRLQNEIVKK
jgi:hypothetical protein